MFKVCTRTLCDLTFVLENNMPRFIDYRLSRRANDIIILPCKWRKGVEIQVLIKS